MYPVAPVKPRNFCIRIFRETFSVFGTFCTDSLFKCFVTLQGTVQNLPGTQAGFWGILQSKKKYKSPYFTCQKKFLPLLFQLQKGPGPHIWDLKKKVLAPISKPSKKRLALYPFPYLNSLKYTICSLIIFDIGVSGDFKSLLFAL